MKKYCYRITMKLFPVYFTAMIIATILIFIFVPTVQAQTNEVALFKNNTVSTSENFTAFGGTTTSTTLLVNKKVDEAKPEMTFFPNPTNQFVQITSISTINNIIVYNDANQVVEDIIIDLPNAQVDFSTSCPGVYYIRVDYVGGSYLKRIILE
jgi:hypothetical protein